MRTNSVGLGDSEVGPAGGHRQWGHFLSLFVHLIRYMETEAWPGFETCCFKEQEGKKQTSFLC